MRMPVSPPAASTRGACARRRFGIAARVEPPWVWSSLALLHLLLNRRYQSLEAVARLVSLCEGPPDSSKPQIGSRVENPRARAAGRALLRLKGTLRRLEAFKDHLGAYAWCERAILLGHAVRLKDAGAIAALRVLASWKGERPHLSGSDEIIILSGACAPGAQEAVNAVAPYLETACEGLSFTIISGGTTSGVSGLAGRIAERSDGRIRAFGYLPSSLPSNAQRDDRRYTALFSAPGEDFTPLDSMRGWTDIVAAGVDPGRVKLLSYGGGEISRAECAIALALGARVGVLTAEAGEAAPMERRLNESLWKSHRNLMHLPLDAIALRSFLLGSARLQP